MSSDADLVLGAGRRESDSVAALYDRHGGRMYAVAVRIAGEAAAGGVLQEVFASICDGGASFDGIGTPVAWLIRLTRDRALAGQTQNPLTAVDSGGALTPRALVEAAFYGGMTAKRVAERLGTPEETIRARLREGMAELRAQLR